MKNRIFKQQIGLHFFIVLILVISTLMSMIRYSNNKEEILYNKARILVASQVNELESKQYKQGEFSYTVFDLDGMVVYTSDKNDYKQGEFINLKEVLQTDKSFYEKNNKQIKVSFVLLSGKKVDKFAVFTIPRQQILKRTEIENLFYLFAPIICGIILVLLILIAINIYMKYHVLDPLLEINQSSKAIIEGNYDIPVARARGNRLLQNEVAELTYGFELMRDQLKEKREKEKELKRSQKELISCISHDLKTPISTIKAYSEGMRDGISNTEEKRKKYVEVIIRKSEVITKMVNDLSEHSNAELNELKIVKSECYLDIYLKKVILELKLLVEHYGLTFEYQCNAANVMVSMDKSRITQVIYNLIENSIKYTNHENGKIKITVFYLETENKIAFSVMDNGSGISLGDMTYVFNKFYRAEKSRSMSIPGSGLGLSICKYIVEAHGGNIKCKNNQVAGAEFIFTIDI
ncbi:HAMP domain-containing histidine kinase [Clostridium sp. CF011]|uniref:sensor histidine kinase n=1 Tax=unclassified Clostridium TaxID=2614128 RepID=UPI001C0CB9DA|nr:MULTISPECIES: HAMP domain-containing sensor histidine kinase [unclassified Clostridium]MBU3093449.1 HAMP domain-containing histidine kinase [Clostridium sp. CF011]MBW9146171.1 HAMP domain-containing histidine kinase [Clostridium sp. CM027]UVE39847.1 HAMP domain-containing histidine kinase [Clostridium sp. CM027]WAG68756.1 HAMP domain-containing histidine kinase [Clostridium sp. CF011]